MILILGGTTEGRVAVRVADEAAAIYYYSTKGTLQSIEWRAWNPFDRSHECGGNGVFLS